MGQWVIYVSESKNHNKYKIYQFIINIYRPESKRSTHAQVF